MHQKFDRHHKTRRKVKTNKQHTRIFWFCSSGDKTRGKLWHNQKEKVASVCFCLRSRHETSLCRGANVRSLERFHLPKSHPASLWSKATASVTFSQLPYVLKQASLPAVEPTTRRTRVTQETWMVSSFELARNSLLSEEVKFQIWAKVKEEILKLDCRGWRPFHGLLYIYHWNEWFWGLPITLISYNVNANANAIRLT